MIGKKQNLTKHNLEWNAINELGRNRNLTELPILENFCENLLRCYPHARVRIRE